MIRVAFLLFACTALPMVGPVAAQDAAPEAKAIGEILAVGAPPLIDIDAALGAEAVAALRNTYTLRGNRPIWFVTAAAPAARALIDRLTQSDLTIGNNLQPLLDAARARTYESGVDSRAAADLLLSALYSATARALRPKDAPAGFAAALDALSASTDPIALLSEPEPVAPAPVAEAPKVETPPAVEAPKVETPPPAPPPPESPEQARIKAALASLQDWPVIPDGPKLALGDAGPRVEALGKHLIASGDLKAETAGAEFDLPLKSALENFQRRHGLPPDGVMGAGTLAALNVPAKDRAASLERNIARSQARQWGERYLVVNLAAARYRLVDKGSTIVEGPAILGAVATPTPVLDAAIDRVELRPSYRIPQSVADRQLWPRQEEDALYFINHGIRVTDDGLRQVPGAGNPLGLAKLLIAGNNRIALHGAPGGEQNQAAFDAPERHANLGCVALPNIAALVKALLAADPAWTEGRIDGALAVGGTQVVALAQPVPVHFVYDTAWIDADGTLQFRDDIYGWDKEMPGAEVNTVPEPCGS
ncbi:peptidoglycan-binding protein [Dongia sp.]|uniref:peptidoglycan-binding protein n=1 Tax=Dongia sp. TaxID=1977262 RepID=UPI003751DDCA